MRAYQGLHVAVKSMSMVSSELGVGSLERRVTRSLRLLDTTPESAILHNNEKSRYVPVSVRLARLVVLGAVL